MPECSAETNLLHFTLPSNKSVSYPQQWTNLQVLIIIYFSLHQHPRFWILYWAMCSCFTLTKWSVFISGNGYLSEAWEQEEES